MNMCDLRLASGGRSETPPPGVPGEEPLTRLNAMRVVIIEDELMVAWALESILEGLGHDIVSIYPSGESAIASGVADATILVVDVNLGSGIDGVATVAELRRASRVPIIFCTAYSDDATRKRALAAAPDAVFVTKPFVERDLERAIQQASRVRH